MLVEDLRGLLGKVPVAVHHVGSLDADLAVLPSGEHVAIRPHDALLHVGKRPPHAAMPPFGWEAPIGHRARLGQAISLGDAHAEALPEPVRHRVGQRLATADRVTQLLEALRTAVARRRERVVHAWNGHEGRRAVIPRQVQHLARLEAGRVDRLRADRERQQREHRESEGVELRQHAQQHVAMVEGRPPPDLVDVGVEIACREHHALRAAARAARVQQHRQIIRASAGSKSDRRHPLEAHLLQSHRLHAGRGSVDVVQHRTDRHHQVQARVLHDVFQVLPRQQVVQGHRDLAGHPGGQKRGRHQARGRQQQSHRLAIRAPLDLARDVHRRDQQRDPVPGPLVVDHEGAEWMQGKLPLDAAHQLHGDR